MLLYLVYDQSKKTVSYPLTAPDLQTAQSSLNQLNPENLSDLIIHPLTTLSHSLDLFLLNIDPEKKLPDFLNTRSGDSSPIADPTTEGR